MRDPERHGPRRPHHPGHTHLRAGACFMLCCIACRARAALCGLLLAKARAVLRLRLRLWLAGPWLCNSACASVFQTRCGGGGRGRVQVRNKDQKSGDYSEMEQAYRPSHAGVYLLRACPALCVLV